MNPYTPLTTLKSFLFRLGRFLRSSRKKAILIGLTIVIILSSISALLLYWPKDTKAAWFDDTYSYRKKITIGNTGAADADKKVKFDIDTATLVTAGKIQSDCDDTRFTDANGKVLRYFLDTAGGACNGASTDYYVLYNTINAGNTDIYMYYGNPAASIGSEAAQFSQATFTPTSGPTLATEEKGTGPLAYWKFDEGTDNTCSGGTNDSCNSTGSTALDGANTSTTWQTEDLCVTGKCLYFNGSTSYVKVSDSTTFRPANITLAAWVKVNANSGDYEFISKQYGSSTNVSYYLKLNSGALQFAVCNTSATCVTVGSGVLPTNQWFYVVGTYDGSTAKLYKNGVLEGQASGSITIGYDTNPIFIGARSIDATTSTPDFAFVQGFMDETKIYNYARTAAQVKTDFVSRGSPEGDSAVLGASKDNNPGALSNGLVGYWKLDESSGNRTDYSGNANTLTDNNTVTSNTGKYGLAGQFTSANSEYLSITDNATLSSGDTDLTIATWVYLDTASADMEIVQKGSDNTAANYEYQVKYQNSTNRFRVLLSNGTTEVNLGADSFGAPSTATWYYILAWYDKSADTVNISVNNGPVDSASFAGGMQDSANAFEIGRLGTAGVYWNGRIDEVRVYKKALTNTEREFLYNWAPGPVAHWKLDENTGTTVFDSSGNGNTATSAFTGNATYAPGKLGSGIEFDGVDDVVRVAESSSTDIGATTDSYTVSAWVLDPSPAGIPVAKMAGGTTYPFRFVNGSGVSWGFNVRCGGVGDNAVSTKNTTVGWHHITGIRDVATDTIYFYLDGILEASVNDTSTATCANNDDFSFGNAGASYVAGDFSGRVDDVRIYRYTRTPRQILEDMNANHPLGGSPVGSQAGYWNMDQMQGVTANDKSINANNLTLSAASWTTSGKINAAWNGTGARWLSRADDADFDFVAASDFSISTWFKSDSASNPGATEYIVNKASATAAGYAMYANTSGQICFAIDDDATWDPDVVSCTSGDFYDATWHHLMGIRNTTSDTTAIYIDGVLRDSDNDSTSATLANSLLLYVGDRDGVDNGDELNGDLDEVKIYRATLTQNEINIDYNAGSAITLGGVLGTQDNEGFGGNPPIVWWKFDENTGSPAPVDSSGNENTGTATSMTSADWVPGKYGSALKFNGSTQYITRSSLSTSITADFTISLWFKMAQGTVPNTQPRMADLAQTAAAGFQPSMTSTGTVGFDDTGGPGSSCFSTATYNDGKWHQFIGTRSGTSYNSYIDGIFNCGVTGGTAPTYTKLYVARETNGTTRLYTGPIDNVKVFNYVFSAAQIAYDMNRGAPLAYYKFDECQGATAYNSAQAASGLAAGNNGTIVPGAGPNTTVGTCGSGVSTEMWNDGTTGKRNASLGFDGTDDYVDLGSGTDLNTATSDLSMSAWIKTTSSSEEHIIGRGSAGATNAFVSRVNGAAVNKFDCRVSSSASATSTTSVNDGNWHLVSCTAKRDGTLTIYIDGRQEAIVDISATSANSITDNNWNIGRQNRATPNAYWDGQLDEVQLYRYVLSANQVKQIYNNGAVFFGPATGSP